MLNDLKKQKKNIKNYLEQVQLKNLNEVWLMIEKKLQLFILQLTYFLLD
jgi:hypothetical protein